MLKAVEEFATECSFIKVFASETLDYVVDEGVQIHGGYGFPQEYACEHAYRDSRINRIFEGTNEINRLLATGMMLKRAQKGTLPLVEAVKKLQGEILAGPQMGGEIDMVANAKKIGLFALGVAFMKYMAALEEQQEVVANITDILMNAYALESATLRAEKIARSGKNAENAKDMVAVFAREAMDTIESAAQNRARRLFRRRYAANQSRGAEAVHEVRAGEHHRPPPQDRSAHDRGGEVPGLRKPGESFAILLAAAAGRGCENRPGGEYLERFSFHSRHTLRTSGGQVIRSARQAAFASGVLIGIGVHAQSTDTRPAFEVASVRPAPAGCHASESPGRMSQCGSLTAYIQIAYNLAALGPHRRPGRRLEILGGPEWVRSDSYQISAKASGDAPSDQMHGPMMQLLLEERFKLRIRRETRVIPVYILSVGNGGSKLKALKEGSCIPPDLNRLQAEPPPGEPEPNYCGEWTASPRPNTDGGLNITLDSRGESIADFAADLSNMGSDRVVVDHTGLTGLFNIHLEYARENPSASRANPVSSNDPPNPSIFTAVQEQLGLRLSEWRGPVEVLVIDHVERPSAN